jgi:hypothetical protein
MAERDSALSPFAALIGTWVTEATYPQFDVVAPGRETFEWLEGGISLDGGVLRLWRDEPGIDQRFAATPGPDTFVGQWQMAEIPGQWKDDVKLIYRRAD